jgi:hypothetical protein
MPADANLIFTRGYNFSQTGTDMRDGVPLNIVTPAVNLQGPGGGVGGSLVAKVIIPSVTNFNPATPGVGAYSGVLLSWVVQVNGGDPATAGLWRDLTWGKRLRPHVPAGTGANTPANPIYSNTAIVRFNCLESNVRLSFQMLGSYANLSNVFAAIYKGDRGGVNDENILQ